MPFRCYTPRATMHSAPIGGFFIFADGTTRVIPDHWLTMAELSEGGRLLRLNYTFCSIEIAGECLDPILEDVGIGKLGAVQVAPSDALPEAKPWVTSIVVIMSPALPEVPSELEVLDA